MTTRSATCETNARIETTGASDPLAWIAHSCTRYLADLSGGLEIDRAITAAYRLDLDGRPPASAVLRSAP